MDGEADPGWRAALVSCVPIVGPYIAKRSRNSDGLVGLRMLFMSFTAALVLIGYVVLILETTAALSGGPVADQPAVIVVVVLGLASLSVRRVERPLPCGEGESLAKSYINRFFLRMAFAEAPALTGFVAYLLTGSGWQYPLGALFAAIGLWRLAPTKTHLAEDEERLREAGCARSLVAALRENPPRGRLSA